MVLLKVYDGSQWVTVGGIEDHGQLGGLGDNDHPQYHLVTDFNAFSAAPLFSSVEFSSNGGTHTLTEGQVAWNDDAKTLDIKASTDVTLQVGQEMLVRVRNKTGGTLFNGSAVYVSGVQGEKLVVGYDNSSKPEELARTVGLLTEDISNNNDGFMTVFGMVRDIDTSPWPVGTLLYLGSDPGSLTDVEPGPPEHAVRVGVVERQHATEGRVFVDVQEGWELHELHDVVNTNASSQGQILYWDVNSSAYTTGDHQQLSGAGTNDHAAIDAHIASASVHFTAGSLVWSDLGDVDSDGVLVGGEIAVYEPNSTTWSGLPAGNNRDLLNYNSSRGHAEWISRGSIDHGQFGGLGDDDHTQYVLTNGNRSMNTLTVTGDATVEGDTFLSGVVNATVSGWNQFSAIGLPVTFYKDSGFPLASAATTTQTTIHEFTVPANVLGPNRDIRVTWHGRLKQNDAAQNNNPIIQFAGVDVLDSGFNLSQDSNTRRWKVILDIVRADTDQQVVYGHMLIGAPANSANGQGNWSSMGSEGLMHTDTTQTESSAFNIAFRHRFNSTATDVFFTIDSVRAEVLSDAV